jgi:hypothetical protein
MCFSAAMFVWAQAGLKGEGEGVMHVADTDDEEDPAKSCVGLWPHFALLNHSCLPTCVHYVVGAEMVRPVREYVCVCVCLYVCVRVRVRV